MNFLFHLLFFIFELVTIIKNKLTKNTIDDKKDKIFLFYDLDNNERREELLSLEKTKIKGIEAIGVFSNPCIELWFLWHLENCQREIKARDCESSIKSKLPDYQKPKIEGRLKKILLSKYQKAINIAKKNITQEYPNPNSAIYRLFDNLNSL